MTYFVETVTKCHTFEILGAGGIWIERSDVKMRVLLLKKGHMNPEPGEVVMEALLVCLCRLLVRGCSVN